MDLGDGDYSAVAAPAAPAAAGSGGGAASLLDDGLGGLEALLGSPAAAAGGGTSNGASSSGPSLALTPGFKLMPGVFQERWRGLAPYEQYVDSLNMATVAALGANSHKDFTTHMSQANIATMASGGQPPMYK